MRDEKATPRSASYGGVNEAASRSSGNEIISQAWSRERCGAIEIGVGGGFVLLAVLAVML